MSETYNKIIFKKSSVENKVPFESDLSYGEVAINYTDGKLYFKDSSNIIRSFEVLPDKTNQSGKVLTTNGVTLLWNNLPNPGVQPEDLAPVATSGAYADLIGLPTLGTAAATDSTAYATFAQGMKADTALQPGVIDDTSIAADKLWSAQKISSELGNIESALDALNGESV